jgi:organic radical activating enzyme
MKTGLKILRVAFDILNGGKVFRFLNDQQTDVSRKIFSICGKGLYLVKTEKYNPDSFTFDKKLSNLKQRIFKIDPVRNSINPIQITIDISANCNAECPFCPRQSLPMNLHGFMKKDMFYDIMRQVEKKMPSIRTIGLAAFGEPLLHPNFDEFAEYTTALGYRVMIPTNMSLAHRHFDALLKLDSVMFSIEGYDKESYEKLRKNLSFETVYNNVKRFDELICERKGKGLHTPLRVLNFIVNRQSDIRRYLELWGDFADDIRIGPMGHPLRWDKKADIFVSAPIKAMEDEILPTPTRIEGMQCIQPFGIITVRADGKLRLCCSDTGSTLDFGDCGNLKKTFYTNNALNAVRKEFLNNKLRVCKNCFQNFGITKERMQDFFPYLKDVSDPKVTIYFNR